MASRNNGFFIVGSLMSVASSYSGLFMLGRLLVGFGVGLESIVVPVLLSEMASDHNRGKLTTLHQLLLTIGILFSGLLGFV